jgi:hypothetical protein
MMVKEVFLDVRFVGTPPNSIGKFGGDTDNWVWPRHTGDFSVFRIYVGKDNKPAPYSIDNVPYKPIHFLPISFKNRKEGDFTMVYGFPGATEQHVVSSYLKFIIEKERPARIRMRDLSLGVIDAAMKESDKTRIQYSAKQASIANAWKKWIGQIDGLKRLDAVTIKEQREKEYTDKANSNLEWKAKYGNVVQKMNDLVAQKMDVEFQYAFAVFIVLIMKQEMFVTYIEYMGVAANVKLVGRCDGEGDIRARLPEQAHFYFLFFLRLHLAGQEAQHQYRTRNE